MNKIQIYGPGCVKCNSLSELASQAVKELGWSVPVEKVSDPILFAVAGVLVTPALVVDGEVLISGKVPSVEELKKLLSEVKELEIEKGCCCSSDKVAEQEPECCGGCCGCGSSAGVGWKKAVIWLAAIVIVLAGIKLANRSARSTEQSDSAGSSLKSGEAQ